MKPSPRYWFELFRVSTQETEHAFVKALDAAEAVNRYSRRCGSAPENFYAVGVAAPAGRAAI